MMTMTDKERMMEQIEMYCDADRRARIDPAEAEKYCPTVEEAMMCAWAEA